MYGEVSFNHRILFQSTTTSVSTRSATIISGCLDYGVGRILSRTTRDAQKQRARRFQSLLMTVEAKACERDYTQLLTSANPGYENTELMALSTSTALLPMVTYSTL